MLAGQPRSAYHGIMIPPLAEFDRAFVDFNVSETCDPTLKADNGPSQLQLIK